jgi:hypothetical protein
MALDCGVASSERGEEEKWVIIIIMPGRKKS